MGRHLHHEAGVGRVHDRMIHLYIAKTRITRTDPVNGGRLSTHEADWFSFKETAPVGRNWKWK